MVDAPQVGRAFEEGVEARAAGQAPDDNPYNPDSADGREWASGFMATFDLDEEDDPLSNRLRKEDDVVDGGRSNPG